MCVTSSDQLCTDNCTQIEITACSRGFYCEEETGRIGSPCLDASIGSNEGYTDVRNCTACPSGKYCAGAGQTLETGDCTDGYWCNSGVNTPVPENYQLGGVILGNRCDKGNFCNTITESPCVEGTYQPDFRKKECYPCPAGYNCDAPGIFDLELHLCPLNSYCEEGTGNSTRQPVACPAGSFR